MIGATKAKRPYKDKKKRGIKKMTCPLQTFVWPFDLYNLSEMGLKEYEALKKCL